MGEPPELALPLQREAFLNRNKEQPKGLAWGQPENVTINYVSKEEEMNEQAQVYPTWDPNESYQQYTILETHGGYEERILDGTQH